MQLPGDMHPTEDVSAKVVEEVRLTYKHRAFLGQICVNSPNNAWRKLSTFAQQFGFLVGFLAMYGYDLEADYH